MRGKRAVELAAGEADILVEEAAASHFAELVQDCDPCLAEEEMQTILGDWAFGRTHFANPAQTKLANWK
eukprot:7262966-Lingulodinium_polyedra.AAC.1